MTLFSKVTLLAIISITCASCGSKMPANAKHLLTSEDVASFTGYSEAITVQTTKRGPTLEVKFCKQGYQTEFVGYALESIVNIDKDYETRVELAKKNGKNFVDRPDLGDKGFTYDAYPLHSRSSRVAYIWKSALGLRLKVVTYGVDDSAHETLTTTAAARL